MPQDRPRAVPPLVPRLAYRDPERAVEWLTRAFGLRERPGARLNAEDGRLLLTELELGPGLVMLSREGSHELTSPATLGGRSQMVLAYVEDVDAHLARARAAGARIVMELADQPWGDRRYEALDPEDHRWYFATRLRDVPAEEWKRAVTP